MDSILGAAGDVGIWAGTIAWAGLLTASCAAVLVALPGGWIALALAVAYDALWGFGAIGWPRLAAFAALNGVGEVVEALLGSIYVAKRGATRWGVAGAFAGGIVGAIAGSAVAPILGTLAGGFLGAFGGAVLAEYWRDRRLDASLRVGLHATVGKLLAALAKMALAVAGATVAAVAAFRNLGG